MKQPKQEKILISEEEYLKLWYNFQYKYDGNTVVIIPNWIISEIEKWNKDKLSLQEAKTSEVEEDFLESYNKRAKELNLESMGTMWFDWGRFESLPDWTIMRKWGWAWSITS